MMFRTKRLQPDDAMYDDAIALLERLVPRGWARLQELGAPVEEVLAAVMEHPTGESRVIGAAIVVALGQRQGDRGGAGLVVGPVVDEQLRRMGVGRRLLTETEREGFGTRRYATLQGRVPEASVSFLESLGWIKSVDDQSPEGLCDLILKIEGESGPA